MIVRIPVTLTWPGIGGPGVNVFHLRTTESTQNAAHDLIVNDALDALNTWYTWIADNLLVQGAKYSMGLQVTDVTNGEAVDYTERTYTNPGATTAAPPHLAVVVGWRTTSATRRGRGRTFLGPLSGNTIGADGTPHDSLLTGLRTATDTFVAAATGLAGGAFAVYGQQIAGNPDLKVARDITSYKVRDTFAVLRSRRQ